MNAHLLQVNQVSKTLGGRVILRDVSLTMDSGDIKVLIGPSGAGKSTFLQCINFLIPPDSGEVWLEGRRIDGKNKADLCRLRQEVGMIFQDFNLFDHLTALDNVALALRKVRKQSRQQAQARARQELERVGLGNRSGLYPAQLSGGQKQRVAIARALAMDPKILLLDEPTSALDPELVGEVMMVIRDLAAGGMPMVMATHQMDFARAMASQILFMEHGSIIEQDSPAVLLAPGAQTRTSDFCSRLASLTGDASENRNDAPITPILEGAV